MAHPDKIIEKVYLVASCVAIFVDCLGLYLKSLGSPYWIIIKVIVFGFLLIVPLYTLSFVGFITALMHDGKPRALLVASSLNLALIVLSTFVLSILGPNAKTLEKNYQRHEQEIEEVVRYTRNAVDEDCRILVCFKWLGKVKYISTSRAGEFAWKPNNKLDKTQVDSLISQVGVTAEELKSIRKMLCAAGCRAILIDRFADAADAILKDRPAEPARAYVLCREGLIGSYYYEFFDEELSEEQMKELDDSTRIVFNNKVCFRYGYVDSDCLGCSRYPFHGWRFPAKRKYLKNRQ